MTLHRSRGWLGIASGGSSAWCLLTFVCWTLTALPVTAADPEVTGELSRHKGVRVLKLWGDAYQRGFAHGYLVAGDVLDIYSHSILDPRLVEDKAEFEARVLGGVVSLMRLDADRTQELEGLLAGIQRAVGKEKMRLEQFGRDFNLLDLKAYNTTADWYRLGCSSFSAWGELSADGKMITGRNLDFMPLPGLRDNPLVIVYLEPGVGKKKWVSMGWPGLIGAYTAMNEEGVTISMHDAPARIPKLQGSFVPRSLALREAIENASARTALKDVQKILSNSAAMVGNNIHVSSPFVGQAIPAGILEYDGNKGDGQGVTLRTAADNGGDKLTHALLCTNHYRKRGSPDRCYRYAAMRGSLDDLVRMNGKVDVGTARRIMSEVAVSETLQTAIFLPDRGELYFGFAAVERNAAEVEPVHFKLVDLLSR